MLCRRAWAGVVGCALLACGLLHCSGEGPSGAFGHQSDAVRYCAGASTLEGIDVSQYQGTIDWKAVAASGRAFAFIRVAHGLQFDSQFDTNWPAAKNAGLVRGVYQFYVPKAASDPASVIQQNATDQANLVLAHLGTLGEGDLSPVLDVEETDGAAPADMAAGIQTWVNIIQSATGRVPMIYTGSYFWNGSVQSTAFANNPLWLAQWNVLENPCPDTPSAWSKWVFQQYSDMGSVSGISARVDLDRFDGTLADLNALTNRPGCTPTCDGSVAVSADCGRVDCAPLSDECSTAGAPHCVSPVCVSSPNETPMEHFVCLANGEVAKCDSTGNVGRGVPCASGTVCTELASGARCLPPAPDGGMDAGAPDAGSLDAGAPADAGGSAADAGMPADEGSGNQAHGGCATSDLGGAGAFIVLLRALRKRARETLAR